MQMLEMFYRIVGNKLMMQQLLERQHLILQEQKQMELIFALLCQKIMVQDISQD